MEIECRSVFTCHRHKSSLGEQLVMKKRGDLVYTSKLSNSNTSNRLCTTSSGLGSGPCPWQLSRLQGSLSLSRPRCGGNRGVRSAEETAAARLRASFLNTRVTSRERSPMYSTPVPSLTPLFSHQLPSTSFHAPTTDQCKVQTSIYVSALARRVAVKRQ